MSADVVPFGKVAKEAPGEVERHLSGIARCISCQHEWVAVVALEGDGYAGDLECPSCGICRGQFKWPFQGPADEEVWGCGACTGQLFMLTRTGTRCVGCGRHQNFR